MEEMKMFNNGNGYNLSDIAAVTRSGSGFDSWGGDGAWWLILLFLFGWGGNVLRNKRYFFHPIYGGNA